MIVKSAKKDIYLPDPATGRLERGDVKKYFTSFGLGLFLLSLSIPLVVEIVAVIVYFVNYDLLYSSLFSNILSLVAIFAVGFPFLFLLTRRLPYAAPRKRSMKAKDFVGFVMILFAGTVCGSMISNLLMSVLSVFSGGESLENPVSQMLEGETFLVGMVFTVILFPVLEELLFRKYLCGKLLPLGEGYAVIISGIVFGLYHGNLFQCFYATINGLVFGFVYVKTGKIGYTIAGHMLMNFFCGTFPTFLYSFLDEQALASGVMSEILPVLPAYIGYIALALGEYVCAIVGLVLIVKHRRRLTVERGLIPPPEEKRVSLVMSNVGMILAACIIGLEFLGSV